MSAAGWTVIGAIATVFCSVLAARYTSRSTVKVAEVNDDAEFRKSLMTRVAALELRLETVERRDAARGDYINLLEHHIWQGNPPPPPARPPGI